MALKKSQGNLVVDLDGTLITTDTLWEVYLQLIKQKPLAALLAIFFIFQGRAHFKNKISRQSAINARLLPYRQPVIDYIRGRQVSGSKIILATAADQLIAASVAKYLGLFDQVIASANGVNLSGKEKAKRLTVMFGAKNFDYLGDSKKDIPVWSQAHAAIIVSTDTRLINQVQKVTPVTLISTNNQSSLSALFQSMRPHQWIKNLLLYIPLLADHQFYWLAVTRTTIAFVSFSLLASAVYLVNDLFDLEADRLHPTKKFRPLASGKLPLVVGLIAIPVLVILSVSLTFYLSRDFIYFLSAYFIINILYSLRLKQIALVDVMVLALLYVMRVLAGGAAANITVSEWLMGLILFLSLSGALLKRFVELDKLELSDRTNAIGRGYVVADRTIIGQLGIISGYLSVLVLTLYVNSATVKELYSYPALWWLNVILLLYLVSRVWLLAYRGQMASDPVLFFLRDKVNYWVIGAVLLLLFLAI